MLTLGGRGSLIFGGWIQKGLDTMMEVALNPKPEALNPKP